jgi:hypothetical protein
MPGAGTTFTILMPIAPTGPYRTEASRWLEPDWDLRQRPQRPRVQRPPLRPRYLVLDEGEALTRLLSRHMPQAEIVPVVSLEEARRLLAGEPSEALLINDASVGDALRRLMQDGGCPRDAGGRVCRDA